MSRKFKLLRDYYEEGDKIFKKGTVEIQSGLTVLIGCNGCGKTTMLRQIKSQLNKEDIPNIHFDNLSDGGRNSINESLFYGNISFVATSMCSSEGENIALNVTKFSQKIGSFMRSNKEASEVWILMDAVDSGLSIDAIDNIKDGLFKTVFENFNNTEIYIVISANEYELARGEKCFDVVNGRYVSIKSYEKYKSVILKSREYKDKRSSG